MPQRDQVRIDIYQSQLFTDVLPAATKRFEDEGIGRFHWTPAADGDEPSPGNRDASLKIMRDQMFDEASPTAAVFIGGMEGVGTPSK